MRTGWVVISCMVWAAGAAAQTPPPAPAPAPAERPLTPAESREMLEAAQATAKATRELVEYNRVMPDLLAQVLAKLDKVEDKLGRIEDALKQKVPPPRPR